MNNRKKFLRSKQGFTLVECIVAMAVLVISSLLLAMIMSATVAQRNKNMALEREMDQQVELLNGGGTGTETPVVNPVSGGINFDDAADGSVIPGNGTSGVVANRKYYDSENVRISNFDYNFSAYNTPKAGGGVGGGSGGGDDDEIVYGSPMISGGANIGGNIVVTETALAGNKKKWTVSFSCTSNSEENSFKIQLPADAKIDLNSSSATGCILNNNYTSSRFDLMENNVVRVCPSNTSITLDIVFEQNSTTNLGEYFGLGNVGATNSVQFPYITSGELPSSKPAGGDNTGGDNTGGTEQGGTEQGGTEQGGTEGGSTEQGGTEGGSTEQGGTGGGSTEQGGTGGGNTEQGGADQGGNAESGNG